MGFIYYSLGKEAHNKEADVHEMQPGDHKVGIYWDKAELYFREAMKIDPNYLAAYFNLGTLKLDVN